MKNILSVLLLGTASLILVHSCRKDAGPIEPSITFTSPSDTTVINVGDTVLIIGTVNDDKSLHELYFTFRNTSTDSIFFSDHPYVHGAKSYYYSYVWYPSSPAVYKFNVTAQDHDDNAASKDFLITVH